MKMCWIPAEHLPADNYVKNFRLSRPYREEKIEEAISNVSLRFSQCESLASLCCNNKTSSDQTRDFFLQVESERTRRPLKTNLDIYQSHIFQLVVLVAIVVTLSGTIGLALP